MINAIKLRIKHNDELIKNLAKVELFQKFRGLPVVNPQNCTQCYECLNCCPAEAISINPFSLDLGKCTLCGDCERICKKQVIKFTNEHRISASNRDRLIFKKIEDSDNFRSKAIEVRTEIIKMFGKSLKLRQVSAAGCNGCELELNACSNINFDLGRYGVEFVASPKHADGVVITGCLNQNMAYALDETYKSIPEPKIAILAGTCAISGGVFQKSEVLDRHFLDNHKIDLFIPGCPVHPMTFITGIMEFLGRKEFKIVKE